MNRSLPMKNRKRSVHDVLDSSASHADLVHNVTDTDCQTQYDSAHGHVFGTFKRIYIYLYITKPDRKWTEKLLFFFSLSFFFLFFSCLLPFLSPDVSFVIDWAQSTN